MCNLYSITRNQAVIRDLFKVGRNLPPLPAIFPDQMAPQTSADVVNLMDALRAEPQDHWSKRDVRGEEGESEAGRETDGGLARLGSRKRRLISDMSPKRRLELMGRNGAVRHSPCSFRMLDRRSDSAGSGSHCLGSWRARA